MEQLEKIKGKSIVIPKMVKRFLIAYYKDGWKIFTITPHVNPEGALEEFYRWQEKLTDEYFKAEYYKIIEVDFEIPFIPKK